MQDLFTELSTDEFVSDFDELARQGAFASEAVPLVQRFSRSLEETRRTIQERFVYYSRLATVGTITHRIVHEILNRTTAYGRALRLIDEKFGPFEDAETSRVFQRAEEAVYALEHLANTYAPLANRNFTPRKQQLVLEERIRACLELNEEDIRSKGIRCHVPDSRSVVTADPGEIDTIILNLVINSTYWLGDVPREDRRIEFELNPETTASGSRIGISIHDTGPGIEDEDMEKVFLPGVTRKPNGIGMGLNVASELVAAYGGEMKVMRQPTKLGGASFSFDLPY